MQLKTQLNRSSMHINDEENQRQILTAAADLAVDLSSGKIMKCMPSVLDGLETIAKETSPESVKKNKGK